MLKNNSLSGLLALFGCLFGFFSFTERDLCFFVCQIFIVPSLCYGVTENETRWGFFRVLPCKPPSCLANLLCMWKIEL